MVTLIISFCGDRQETARSQADSPEGHRIEIKEKQMQIQDETLRDAALEDVAGGDTFKEKRQLFQERGHGDEQAFT